MLIGHIGNHGAWRAGRLGDETDGSLVARQTMANGH
jgi:hypothetical protein